MRYHCNPLSALPFKRYSEPIFAVFDRGNDAVRRSGSWTCLPSSRPVGSSVPPTASTQIHSCLLGIETHTEVLSKWVCLHHIESHTLFFFKPWWPNLMSFYVLPLGWIQLQQSEYPSDQSSTLCAEPSPWAARALWAKTHTWFFKSQQNCSLEPVVYCIPFVVLSELNRRWKRAIADFTHHTS